MEEEGQEAEETRTQVSTYHAGSFPIAWEPGRQKAVLQPPTPSCCRRHFALFHASADHEGIAVHDAGNHAHSGEILTVEQTLECEKYGVLVKAEVEWAASLLEGKRKQLHVSEVRDAVLHIVGAGKAHHKPAWLTITVRPSPCDCYQCERRWACL